MSELFFGPALVTQVKILIPLIGAKKRRMPLIAANGLVILVPSALYLAAKAEAGAFDAAFYGAQALERVAGAVNIALLGLNMRDGFHLTARRRMVLARRA